MTLRAVLVVGDRRQILLSWVVRSLKRLQKETRNMAPVSKLKANLPTQEGRTLIVGTEVTVTNEFSPAWNDVRFRIILVGAARYRVREEDLAYAWAES